ncbi:MAG: PEGA domain-containing protein [Ignavibacteriales bacterium]|nr:PEGA domain-containing protein [Ignavibacteriales bacterium]
MKFLILFFSFIIFFTHSSFAFQEKQNVVGGSNDREETISVYDNSWALIIGVNKYADAKIPSRRYAVDDAKAVAKILEEVQFPKSNIKIILNEQATLRQLKEEFSALGAKVKKNDRLLIYWAAHAETEILPSGKEMGYLVPSDGKSESLYGTCLSMDVVKQLFDRIAAKHLLLLVDANFRGLNSVTSKVPSKESEDYQRKILTSRGFHIITAGTKNEQHVESQRWGHSAFTQAFLDGFWIGNLDNDDDGLITSEELFFYLSKNVFELSKKENGKGQHPVFASLSSSQGEFIFPLEGQYYTLLLNDLPAQNKVYIGGKKVSENQPTVRKTLERGDYNVEVESPGRKKYSTTVQLNGNQSLKPKLPKMISYSVQTNPAGAKVFIDSVEIGTTPLKTQVAEGMHFVEIRKEGFEPISFQKNISEKNAFEQKELLPVIEYTVTFSEIPEKNFVTINGDTISTNQKTFKHRLRPGIYSIVITSPGHETYSTTLDLKGDLTILPVLPPQVAYYLETEPPGAKVIFDDTIISVTPFERNVSVGEHSVTLVKENFDTITFRPFINEETRIEKKELILSPTGIIVQSFPESTTIYLNDEPQGKTPDTLRLLPGYPYTVALKDTHGRTLSTSFAGEGEAMIMGDFSKKEIEYRVTKKVLDKSYASAFVNVEVIPSDAQLLFDEKTVILENGKTILKVHLGMHTFIAFKNGFEVEKKVVHPEGGDVLHVKFVLTEISSSKWWLWTGAGVFVTGTAALIYINQIPDDNVRDPYGTPPAFPPTP